MEIVNRLKAGIQNVALQFIPREEKITRVFLNAGPQHVKHIVVMPVTIMFAKKIHQKMKNVKHIGKLWNGTLNGVEITMVRQEMGAPNTAIMLEALKCANARTVIRVDFCGGIAPEVEVGHITVPRQAYIGDGTTPHYFRAPKTSTLPVYAPERPRTVVATNELHRTLLETAQKFSNRTRISSGAVWTTDALFQETPEKVKYWRSLDVETVDMESSTLFYVGAQKKIRVASILAVSDQVGHPEYDFLTGTKVHPKMETGVDLAVKILMEALPEVKFL